MLPFASTLIRFVKAPPRAPIARAFLCSSSGGRRKHWPGPLLASDGKTFKEFTKCSSSVAVTPAITRPPLHLPHTMAHDADFQLARIRAKTAAARARPRNHQVTRFDKWASALSCDLMGLSVFFLFHMLSC
jgi:hypothetical protein